MPLHTHVQARMHGDARACMGRKAEAGGKARQTLAPGLVKPTQGRVGGGQGGKVDRTLPREVKGRGGGARQRRCKGGGREEGGLPGGSHKGLSQVAPRWLPGGSQGASGLTACCLAWRLPFETKTSHAGHPGVGEPAAAIPSNFRSHPSACCTRS